MAEYEFSEGQNTEIGSLAHKMRWVGLFFIIVGILALIGAISVLLAIYQDKLPGDWVSNLPAEAQEQMNDLPPNHQLWGIFFHYTLVAIIYLLLGVWTRSSAAYFQKVVDTRGNDITNLMDALGALNKMYGVLYLLLVIGLILLLVAVALSLYLQFSGT